MRTLKYALLGLLSRGPMTGYDLMKEFEMALGAFWSARHSQIYPELKRLDEEELIRYETVIQGERMEKKLYTITPAGREAFAKWITKKEPLEPTPKDIFRLRMFLSDTLSDAEMIAQLRDQRARRQQKYETLVAGFERDYRDRDIAALDPVTRGDYMVLRGGILREQAYLDWLDECLAMFESARETSA